MSFKKRLIAFISIVCVPIFIIWIVQPKIILLSGTTMGTTYSIKLYAPAWVTKASIQKEVTKKLVNLNAIFSTWDIDSEVSKFNNFNSTEPMTISSEFKWVYESAYDLYEITSGYYDPTIKPLLDLWGFVSTGQYYNVPTEKQSVAYKELIGLDKINQNDHILQKTNPKLTLDFSSIAKGYAVDVISKVLMSFHSKQYMIEIGGEVLVASKEEDTSWAIGIVEPSYDFGKQSLYATLSINNGAVASSGDYRNYFKHDGEIYSHIFDAIQQKPIQNNVAGVTIIASSCMLADGLATSIMALGIDRGLAVIEALEGVECLILYRDNGVFVPYFSSGFEQYIKPEV